MSQYFICFYINKSNGCCCLLVVYLFSSLRRRRQSPGCLLLLLLQYWGWVHAGKLPSSSSFTLFLLFFCILYDGWCVSSSSGDCGRSIFSLHLPVSRPILPPPPYDVNFLSSISYCCTKFRHRRIDFLSMAMAIIGRSSSKANNPLTEYYTRDMIHFYRITSLLWLRLDVRLKEPLDDIIGKKKKKLTVDDHGACGDGFIFNCHHFAFVKSGKFVRWSEYFERPVAFVRIARSPVFQIQAALQYAEVLRSLSRYPLQSTGNNHVHSV